MEHVRAFIDGACAPNPGSGGWGVLLFFKDGNRVLRERELSGGVARTTNNRMELLAAIHALEALDSPSRITVCTDSTYVREGITRWIHRWKVNGWQAVDGRPVRNADLWRRLDAARSAHDASWEWVRGHAGNRGNERADGLARQGRVGQLESCQ
ncbi:MAG: ribonuclease HI [Boseongicola sp. SB0677_bin_26]|nr:ribonuclease HI [Boseongicola sp. SB0665_bin_10]MYG25046.1 ribonuclease HI [Boseongicola sp. SB0677_bin_26]